MRKKTRVAATPLGDAVLCIPEQQLIMLQTTPHVSQSDVQDMVFQGLWALREKQLRGAEWLAFSATECTHWSGKSLWLGFSESVPLPLVDAFQGILEKSGLEVEREMGFALRNELIPFARLSGDGLELLAPAALAGDTSNKRTVKRGSVEPIVRAFRWAPSAA